MPAAPSPEAPSPPAAGPAPRVAATPRFELLDAGRGVACLLVVLHHAVGTAKVTNGGRAIPRFLGFFEEWGWLGVQGFFVISGYCIAAAAAGSAARPRPLPTFASRRARRILPTFWIALATIALFGLGSRALHARDLATWLDTDAATGAHWLTNAALAEPLVALFGVQPDYACDVIWSLCYEAQLYVFAALAWVSRRRPVVVAWTAGLTIAAVLFREVPALRPHGLLTDYWLDFAAGAWLWGRTVPVISGRERVGLDLGLVVAAGLPLATALFDPDFAHDEVRDAKTAVLCGALGILLFVSRRHDARLASLRPARALAWVGERSYSIYLLHLPIVRSLVTLAARHDLAHGAALWAVTALASGSALALCTGFYNAVERRFVPGPARAPVPVGSVL